MKFQVMVLICSEAVFNLGLASLTDEADQSEDK